MSGDDIASLLREVADALPHDGPRYEVVLVGGSLMALMRLREATADVDSVSPVNATLRSAIAVVARRHGLSDDWLNDRAAPFQPVTLDRASFSEMLDTPRLRVVGVSLTQLFLMKMHASRDRDVDDLATLWPHTDFETAEEAATAYSAAYPEAPVDPYLADWVRSIVGER